MKRGGKLRTVGRRGRMNRRAQNVGDKAIRAAGVTSCELRLEGCTGSWALTRAHRKKRRFCDEKELAIYAVACASCHDIAESKSHEEMFDIINAAIQRRSGQ